MLVSIANMDKDEILEKVAENIRIERLRQRLSQEKLAEMSGITQKYLDLIENKKSTPSIVIIVNICNSLKMELNSLLK